MNRPAKWVSALLVIAFVGWHGVVFGMALFAPLSWDERDWNRDGHMSYAEFTEAVWIGKMPVECPGKVLGTEYFDAKSVNRLKVDCARRWTGPREPRFL